MDHLLETLHPLERGVVIHLKDHLSFSELVKQSQLSEVEVMRALQWLENKEIIKIEVEEKEVFTLDENGLLYLGKGLPERQLLNSLSYLSNFEELQKNTKLSNEEFSVALGVLKKKNAIDINGSNITLTGHGREIQNQILEEENFLRLLPLEKLSKEQRVVFDSLRKRRNIVKIDVSKLRSVILTQKGKELIIYLKKNKFKLDLIDSVTPEILRNSSWKKKPFRRYDISINVPEISGGKRHFVNQAVDYARRVWLDLGFKEMNGNLLQTSFWNFDALFTAQDHPVRELQDTFYVKDPSKGKLPDKKLVDSVRRAHEKGVAGSKGWQYNWDQEEARRNVLRTHTTVLSARTLAALSKEELPAKFFAVGKCFRNETLDWSHLFEFNQFEGIVVDQNANFRHLLGYLKEFAGRIGFSKIRFRPAHFPYTEPSVEGEVYDSFHKEWIEVFAAGMLRPEVVVPLLGRDIPVLAWGPGLDRMMLSYYNINDLRDLYKNDIKQLKNMRVWLK